MKHGPKVTLRNTGEMELSGERDLRWLSVPWRAADAASGTALVFGSFVAFFVFLLMVDDLGGRGERALVMPWVLGVLEGVMVLAVWAFGIRKYGAPWRALGLTRPEAGWKLRLILAALAGSLLFAGIYSAIVIGLRIDLLRPPQLPSEALGQGLPRMLNSLVLVLWGPFAEELFFRGFLLAALVPAVGKVGAVVISSAIFAVGHLTLGTMVPIFVTGLLLSWLYLRTRSLWPPIAAHAAQNLIAVTFVP